MVNKSEADLSVEEFNREDIIEEVSDKSESLQDDSVENSPGDDTMRGAKFEKGRSSKRKASKIRSLTKKSLLTLTPTGSKSITPGYSKMSSPSPSKHCIKENKYDHKNSNEKSPQQSSLPSKNQTEIKKKETNAQSNTKNLAALK